MTIDEYYAKWEATFAERGHTPKLNDDGDPDWFAMSWDIHNGPECTTCGWSKCQHCTSIDAIPMCLPTPSNKEG